jgi:hypothetical protein
MVSLAFAKPHTVSHTTAFKRSNKRRAATLRADDRLASHSLWLAVAPVQWPQPVPDMFVTRPLSLASRTLAGGPLPRVPRQETGLS